MTPLASASILAIVLALAGCPSPNVYGTARTLPKGESQHTFAFERFSVIGTSFSDGSATSLPTYQYRYGVGEHADIGIRIANATSLGGDVKWNFLRGTTDLAIAPGFTGTYVALKDEESSVAFGLLHFQLPLLVGLHSGNTGVVLSPGLGMAIATAKATSGGAGRFVGDSTPFARFGVGVNVRATSSFAIHPEVTALKYFGAEGQLLTVGVGFTFGSKPRTNSELRERENNRERATRFANDAIAAAAQGDCATVARLSVRVREFDVTVHRGLRADSNVAECLVEADHARLTALHSNYEACRQKRIEIARDAAQITNLKERGRVFMSMPVCGGAPPPPPNLDGLRVRRAQAIAGLTKTAADAARRGDCASAKQLEPRVREIDAGLRDTVFMRDVDVARCFAVVAVKPPLAPLPVEPVDPDTKPTAPAPTAPGPTIPGPTTPAPAPAPSAPAPTAPAPTTPAPTTPVPTAPAPTAPSPTTPTSPVPTAPAPTAPTPNTPTSPPPIARVTPTAVPGPVRPAPSARVADSTPLSPIGTPIVAEPRRPFPRRSVAITIGGLGVIASAVTIWAGLEARSQRDEARELGCNSDLTMCSGSGIDAANQAHARGTLATGMFVGSLALLSGAAALWFTVPGSHKQTAWRLAPTSGTGVVLGRGF